MVKQMDDNQHFAKITQQLTELNTTSRFPRTSSATQFSFYHTTSSCVYVSKSAHTTYTSNQMEVQSINVKSQSNTKPNELLQKKTP
jgi:hypothetical protein